MNLWKLYYENAKVYIKAKECAKYFLCHTLKGSAHFPIDHDRK